jgi:4-amino-4-deoxy-L-arabinose transferase-like glycosyltransferase
VLERKVKETISNKHFWLAILVALAIILPWHIIMYDMHGKAFIDRYILYDLFARSINPLEGNDGTSRYYFDRILYDYSPWFLLLPIALADEARRVPVTRDRSSVLLIFVGCVFGIYSLFVNTKIFHYLTPIYPILALFIANAFLQAYENNKSTAYGGLVIAGFLSLIIPSRKVAVLLLILIGVMWIALSVLVRVSTHRRFAGEIPILKDAPGEDDRAVNHFLHWLSFIVDRKNFAKLTTLIILVFFTLIGALRSRSLYRVVDSPVEQIARVAGMSDVVRDETIVALALPPDYQYAIVGPTAMFYSHRPIIVAWSEDQLSQFTSDGSREIIMAEIFIETLNNEYEFTILAESPPFFYGIIQQRDK